MSEKSEKAKVRLAKAATAYLKAAGYNLLDVTVGEIEAGAGPFDRKLAIAFTGKEAGK